MKTTKLAGILTGMFIAVCAALTAQANDCCVLCGECDYTPTYTPTYTTTTTATTGCVFCGGGTYTTTTTTTGSSKIYPDFSKAQTLIGYFTGPSVSGTATLKVGKISKKGKIKISATLKATNGKKYTASASVDADSSGGSASGMLPFSSKNVGTMDFTIEADETQGLVFSGSSANGYTMESYEAEEIDPDDDDDGGTLGSVLAFTCDASELEAPEDWDFVTDAPNEEPVYMNSKGKWVTNSSPKIKVKKTKEDGETYYEITGLDDENNTNVSALKCTINMKKGKFSGSFRLYAAKENDKGKITLKKYTVKFSGRIVGSGGTGTATVKIGKVKYSLPVAIETIDED